MGLFSRKPKPEQEKTIVQLRTETYSIQPGEDLSRLEFSGSYTADGEPVYRWRVERRHVDRRVTLERE